jgi:hypothetical protein
MMKQNTFIFLQKKITSNYANSYCIYLNCTYMFALAYI